MNDKRNFSSSTQKLRELVGLVNDRVIVIDGTEHDPGTLTITKVSAELLPDNKKEIVILFEFRPPVV